MSRGVHPPHQFPLGAPIESFDMPESGIIYSYEKEYIDSRLYIMYTTY